MSIDVYTPDASKILHTTGADFGDLRTLYKAIRVVQYDNSLPIIAVNLYLNGAEFVLSNDYSCKIRFSTKNNNYVYKDILGCSEDRKTVYFEIDENMTIFDGTYPIVLELTNNGVACSSYISLFIDKNPIQRSQMSTDGTQVVYENYIVVGNTVLTESDLKKILNMIGG